MGMAAKQCPNCGNEYSPFARYCHFCGGMSGAPAVPIGQHQFDPLTPDADSVTMLANKEVSRYVNNPVRVQGNC